MHTGYNVCNYTDEPDTDMNQLLVHVSEVLSKHIPSTHYPYWLGIMGGYCFDLLAKLTGKKLTVSSVPVKKFCTTTQFDAKRSTRAASRHHKPSMEVSPAPSILNSSILAPTTSSSSASNRKVRIRE